MVKEYKYINTESNLYDLDDKPLVIWGRSVSALKLYLQLKFEKVNVIGFTDSFVTEANDTFCGLKVFTYEELEQAGEINIYIATQVFEYRQQIMEKLQYLENATVFMCGVVWGCGKYDTNLLLKKIREDEEKINFVKKSLCDDKSIKTFENLLQYRLSNKDDLIMEVYESEHQQYFPGKEILTTLPGEVFIDAGAYNGETSEKFSKWCKDYSKIYLMEPDGLMFQVAKEYIKLKKIDHVNCINKGAYSHTTEIGFMNIAESGSSNISEDGKEKIQTISIDEMLAGEKATYIKMDIEGAEMAALEGAEKTIVKYKPKLAISIYHNEDDLWKIPFYIKNKYPWYRIFIRHYTSFTTETVLYAIV